MKRITATAHARAALSGNPSDGYFGKTLSVSVRNFSAKVVIYEWPVLEIIPPPDNGLRFDSLDALAQDVGRNGYYGALRLIKASLKRFHDYCGENSVFLTPGNFSLRFETDVPRGVGLAGSSAIITATFRALTRFYNIEIPREILPNWILSVEREELRIQGGLQDRVAQVYEGVTLMDFEKNHLESAGFGIYQSLDPQLLPPLYLAYQTELAEPSDVVHNDLRARYDRGDAQVVAAMETLRGITDRAANALAARDFKELGAAIDANFDVRTHIMTVSKGHLQMVEIARACGASANFAGSGGAIIGTIGDARFSELERELGAIGCRVIVPLI